MPFSINTKKLYFIAGYLLLLFIIWFILKRRNNKENFDQDTNSDIIKSFGTILRDKPEVEKKSLLFKSVRPDKTRHLPTSYPGTDINSQEWTKYLSYLSTIGNQRSCGSCWAWSTSAALSDRFSLLSLGKIKVPLSPAKMVMCTFKFDELDNEDLNKWWNDRGQPEGLHAKFSKELKSQIACAGNDLYSALQELYTFGTTSNKCVPYNTTNIDNSPHKYDIGKSSDPSNIPNCWDILSHDIDTCTDGTNAARIYRADDIYSLRHNENEIMQEIYRWGPVSAGFKVYEGFLDKYDGKTIYSGPSKQENPVGGHAIRIVGWGEENGIKYWWIANSWSSKWGMNGFFRMKRMIPECQLEQNVVAMKPEFPGKTVWGDASLDIAQTINRKLRDFFGHNLDPTTLYFNTSLDKIKNGQLKGDLKPIITQTELPNKGNYSNFWVADLIGGKFIFDNHTNQSNITNIVFIILAILGVLLVLKI